MVPGQAPFSDVQSLFRVQAQKLEDDGLCSSNVSLSHPLSAAESVLGGHHLGKNLSFPLCSPNASEVVVSMLSMAGSLFGDISPLDGQSRLLSDPMTLSLTAPPCSEESACTMEFSVSLSAYRNTSQQAEAVGPMPETFVLQCREGDEETALNHRCESDGEMYSLSCRGKEESLEGVCPTTFHARACEASFGDNQTSSCFVARVTNESIWCSCSLWRSRSQSEAATVSTSVKFHYMSVLKAVTSSFTTTVLSAGDLSVDSVTSGYLALATVGSFMGCVVAALYLSQQADQRAKKVDPGEDRVAARARLMKTVKSMGSSFLGRRNGGDEAMERRLRVQSKGRVGADARRGKGKREKTGFLAMAEEALPNVLRARSLWRLMKEELKRHHRWFGVCFYYSDQFPRVLRVTALATNIIIMLFIQSLTYELTNGDDGSCERLDSEERCLEESSAFATGATKCYWLSDEQSCYYMQPDSDTKIVLFVAMFSAIVATPFAVLTDHIISRFLSAPLLDVSTMRPTTPNRMTTDGSLAMTSIAPAPTPAAASPSLALTMGDQRRLTAIPGRNPLALQQSERQFSSLSESLRQYLLFHLDREQDKEEFKGESGCVFGCDDASDLIDLYGTWLGGGSN